MPVPDSVREFVQQLDLEKLRVRRPVPTIFLCGGVIAPHAAGPHYSLRSHIHHVLGDKLGAPIALAEAATDIFELSEYNDLISFEGDVAALSGLTVIICESPGSLAELGAFAFHNDLSRKLYVLLERGHYDGGGSQSFIRRGPVLRLEKISDELVGAFSWDKIKRDGRITSTSFRKIKSDLASHIRSRIQAGSSLFENGRVDHRGIALFWIARLMGGATPAELKDAISDFGVALTREDTHRLCYSMKALGWLDELNAGSRYFFPLIDQDPFDYAFRANVSRPSATDWKFVVGREMGKGRWRRPADVRDRMDQLT